MTDETRDPIDIIREAASDLEAAARNEWGWPDVHPANRRKYDRDMAFASQVMDAADAFATLRASRDALARVGGA